MALFDYYSPAISQDDFNEKVPNLYKINTDVLSSYSFTTIDWNNNPVTIPSVSETRQFKYLLDNVRMIGIIRPKTRDFLILTMGDEQDTATIMNTQIGPTIVVKDLQNRPLVISYYTPPTMPVIDPPPESRLAQVYEKGLTVLDFSLYDLLIILLMLVFVISAIAYLSGYILYDRVPVTH